MQELPRENAVPSSKPEDHPQVVHMTRNLSGIPEKRPPGLEAQARVSERSKEASMRLFTGFYFISLGFYQQHWLIVLCFFIFVFVFSRLRACLKQESGCKIEWLLSLPHLSNASLFLGLPSLHPRSLQSSHFLHFRAKEHSGDRQQGFYSTWSSPQKKKKRKKGKKRWRTKVGRGQTTWIWSECIFVLQLVEPASERDQDQINGKTWQREE